MEKTIKSIIRALNIIQKKFPVLEEINLHHLNKNN